MTTRRPSTPRDAGSILSPETADLKAEPGAWTPEEMAKAQPMPLPTAPLTTHTRSAATTPTSRTSPAGRPEQEQ